MITPELRILLESLVLAGSNVYLLRTCPKCNKKHSESRAFTPKYYNYKQANSNNILLQGFETLGYNEKYYPMCFACIQVELLLPSY